MAERRLPPKQQRFVDEYLSDPNLNATAAYRRAYPACASDEAARSAASRLLASVNVQDAIAARRASLASALDVTPERVARELALVAFSDVGGVLDFTGDEPRLRPARDIPESARRAIASVKVRRYTEGRGDAAREVEVTEFRLWNKLDALGRLMAHLGMDAAPPPPPPANNVNVNVFPSETAVLAFLASLAGREVADPLRLDAVGQPPLPAPQAAPQAGAVPPGG